MAKILFALHQFFPRFYTGTETLTLEVAKELQSQGHAVSILCVEPSTPDYPIPDEPELFSDVYDGIPIWRLSTGIETDLVKSLDYESYDKRIVPLLEHVLVREKPDIVHAFHLMRLTLSFVEVVKNFGIPFYLTTTDFWHLCPTYRLLKYNGALCFKPGRVTCFQCVLAMHMNGNVCTPKKMFLGLVFPRLAALFNSKVSSCQRILEARIERNHRLLKMIDGVFWSNEFLKNIFTKNGFLPKRHKIIEFPVPQKASSLFELPLAEESSILRIAFVGTLNPSKGPQVAIKAVSMLNPEVPVQLSIWGAAERIEFESELKELAKNDSRITFCGTFPQEKFAEVLRDIDVLVIPSLWYENTPLTALSSLAARRVLIVSNLGGLCSLVENGRSGYVFPPGDSLALSRILIHLAKNKSELYKIANVIKTPARVANYVEELLQCYNEFAESYNSH